MTAIRLPTRAVLVLGVAVITAGVLPLDPPVASAWSTTIDIDQRHGFTMVEEAAAEADRACVASERVTVRVRTATGSFKAAVDCAGLGADSLATVTEELVLAASQHDDAAEKVALRVALYRELLPDVAIAPERMEWALAAGPGLGCQRARDRQEIAEMMAGAARSTGETAEHWTLVEAVDVVVSCPKQLPSLLRNVARVGETEAATAAKRRLEQSPLIPKLR